MEKFLQIQYRGSLKSCNYSCSYCPFSKKKESIRQCERDREELFRFVNRLVTEEFHGAVQLVPYGEVMRYEYYWEALARLSQEAGIATVGAQTNLSFPVKKMLSVYEEAGGDVRKLRIWGTFHPEMVAMEEFLSSCHQLQQAGVALCVGSVGVPENISVLQQLRGKLYPSMYLWINKMDGLTRNYTQEEVEKFCEIDPYFELELRHVKANVKRCKTSIFVDGAGDIYLCNMCKNSVGNIYESSLQEAFDKKRKVNSCDRKQCDCYIAYSNRKDIEELVFFQPYPVFRIPTYRKAVFFDIDGTLVMEGETEISPLRAKWVQQLSETCDVLLATSLPYEEAMKKIRPIAPVIRGGVFAGGGRLRIVGKTESKPVWEQIEEMSEDVVAFVERLQSQYAFRFRVYRKGKLPYKIVIHFWVREIPQIVLREIAKLQRFCHVIIEDDKVEITAAGASKWSGVQKVCREMGVSLEEVVVFGNSENDLEMIQSVPFSVAAPGSCKAVKDAAMVVLE